MGKDLVKERREERGERREEKGERRKEKGERRKERGDKCKEMEEILVDTVVCKNCDI
ncbi:MAG TPA: hypothetical protein PLL28_11940 [Chitinophagales bacterium]|nr:hypothetical protein [Chitinophagales bacterium]